MARRLRTFIAIDPGQAIRERLVAMQETLARTGAEVNWVEPENLHVTLLFLGEVGLTEVSDVCAVVAKSLSGHKAFAMTIAALGCFPNPRRPRVVWAGVGEGTPEVCAIHDALEDPLYELGCYRREARKYTPHITLGRVKSDCPTEPLAFALAKRADWKAGEIIIRDIHVMSSELTPDGPIYTVLSRAKLKGNPQ